MTFHLCSLHNDEADWHEAGDPVGVIPALSHGDGTWEPIGLPAIGQDRGCAVANGVEPERIVELDEVPS